MGSEMCIRDSSNIVLLIANDRGISRSIHGLLNSLFVGSKHSLLCETAVCENSKSIVVGKIFLKFIIGSLNYYWLNILA